MSEAQDEARRRCRCSSVVREVRRGAGDPRPLAVAGARELVPLLARELRAGGDAAAVVEGGSDRTRRRSSGSARPTRRACARPTARGMPIVGVTGRTSLPYVLATDLVRVPPGQGFPVEEIAARSPARSARTAPALAARLPVLRGARSCDALIASFSKRNGLIAAAVFVPGVDMPVLTLNQLRLVLRIATGVRRSSSTTRARSSCSASSAPASGSAPLARELLDLVPVAGWAVKGGVAYTGTRAVGEAAVRYFEARADTDS